MKNQTTPAHMTKIFFAVMPPHKIQKAGAAIYLCGFLLCKSHIEAQTISNEVGGEIFTTNIYWN